MSSHALLPKKNLLNQASFLGMKLWVLLVIFIVLLTILSLIIFLLWLTRIHYRRREADKSQNPQNPYCNSSLDRWLLSLNISEIGMKSGRLMQQHGQVFPDQLPIRNSNVTNLVKDVWRGNNFSLRELEVATNGFSKQNLIGSGDYGIVYHGILLDNTRVAVKRLVSDRFQVEDFVAEMESIGFVRHKNLVKLLGYHIERAYRLLVHEHVDNRSLHHWIHECSAQVSPLTWSIRLKIIQGIAKGLAYLHEDIEPKILHRTLTSNNILLDHQWEPKISDFGLAKLYNPAWGITIMESLGYVAPEYASTGDLTEKFDVHSFGVILMEIISGRTPIHRGQSQPYLVDWLKSMVAAQDIASLVDPKIPLKPSSRELKRVLLVAIRCVDPDLDHRPTMGEVSHMLEPRDLLLYDDQWVKR